MLRMSGRFLILWPWLIATSLSTFACAQEMGGQGQAARSGMPSGAMSQPMPGMSMPPTTTDRPAARPSAAVGPMMSMADFERIAMQRNPTLKQAAAQFEAALSRSHQAGLYPNPTLGYVQDQIGSYSETRPTANGFAVKGTPSPGDNVGGFVQWQIVTAGKLRLSRAKFAEEANAARWQAIAQELRVINSVRIGFFEVVAAQRMIAIQREIVQLDEDAVRTTRERVNVGQANEPDLLQVRVQERRARVHLRNAENRYRGDWEELTSVVGAPDLRPTALDPRSLEAEIVPLDFDGTLADLLNRSPEMQAALSEIRRDQIMVRRERVEPIPNILLQAVTGYNYEFGVQTAGVQVGFTLPVFNRNQGTIREAMSDLTRDHAEYDRVALSLAPALRRGVHPLSERLAVGGGLSRREPAHGSSSLRATGAELPTAEDGVARSAGGPAQLFRSQQGLRGIADGPQASGSRDRRDAADRWAELAVNPDFAGPHRIRTDATMIESGHHSPATVPSHPT